MHGEYVLLALGDRFDLAAVLAYLAPPAWHADAACKEHPELDFIPRRRSTPDPRALAVCASCLVRDECRQWALDQQDPGLEGIYGGMTQAEREPLLRAQAILRPAA